jgi:hypothetical protein
MQTGAFIPRVLDTEIGPAQPVLEANGHLIQSVNWDIPPNGEPELWLLRNLSASRSESKVRLAVSAQQGASYKVAQHTSMPQWSRQIRGRRSPE